MRTPVPLVVFSATLVVAAVEYLGWAAVGESNELAPVALTALGIATAAGGAAALTAYAWSPLRGSFIGLALAWVPFASAGVVPAVTSGAIFAVTVALWWRARPAIVIGATAALCLATVVPPDSRRPARKATSSSHRPDIVLLVMDTTRQDRLSIYGYPRSTTPHLERFAERAQVYDDAWSVAPWTSPSHASMFTGLLPAEHGVDGALAIPFPEGIATLPQVLSEAGYRTAGFPGNPNLYAPGWERGFDAYFPAEYQKHHSLIRVLNRLSRRWRDPAAHAMSDRLLARARRWWRDNEGAPRFLFVNLIDPHGPHIPTHPSYERFLPEVPLETALAVHARRRPDGSASPPWKAKETDILSRLYDAEIADMDERIGDFIAWLEARGELDDTLSVITSDHGERLGERGLVGHSLLMDPYLLRVPLLVRYPPKLEPERISRRVQLDGLAGFMLDTAGISGPLTMDNFDIRAVAVAQLRPPESIVDDMVEVDPDFDAARFRRNWCFVARESFALEWPVGGTPVLTDLERDPHFEHDVSSEHPHATDRLLRIARELPDYERIETRDVDPELLDELKALGYVQ